MVSGRSCAVTPSPRVSQWAEIITPPLGLPMSSPNPRQAAPKGPPSAFMGEPWPKKAAGWRVGSAELLLGVLGDVLALEAGAVQVDLAGHARAVALGQGGGAIGAAADDLVHIHLALEGIGQADHDQAVMHQGLNQAHQGGFLAAVLC